jgi:hypothetical protein
MGATGRPKKLRKEPAQPPIVDPVQPSEIGKILKGISEELRNMSPAEFRESLKAAGIIGADGKLTANYASTKKK